MGRTCSSLNLPRQWWGVHPNSSNSSHSSHRDSIHNSMVGHNYRRKMTMTIINNNNRFQKCEVTSQSWRKMSRRKRSSKRSRRIRSSIWRHRIVRNLSSGVASRRRQINQSWLGKSSSQPLKPLCSKRHTSAAPASAWTAHCLHSCQSSKSRFVYWRLSSTASTSRKSKYSKMTTLTRSFKSSATILIWARMRDRDCLSKYRSRYKWMMIEQQVDKLCTLIWYCLFSWLSSYLPSKLSISMFIITHSLLDRSEKERYLQFLYHLKWKQANEYTKKIPRSQYFGKGHPRLETDIIIPLLNKLINIKNTDFFNDRSVK